LSITNIGRDELGSHSDEVGWFPAIHHSDGAALLAQRPNQIGADVPACTRDERDHAFRLANRFT
jgi:hypothetical protein